MSTSGGDTSRVGGLLRLALLIAWFYLVSFTFISSAASAIPRHDRDLIRFFSHHPKLALTPAGQRAMWTVIAHLTRQVRSLQDAQPAHEELWKCIAGYPGARPGGGSGESRGDPSASNGSHYNILQMTNPWYGTDPIGLPPDVIMRKAEEQYAASGYSRAWLGDQWGQTMGPCWQYS